jgi:hypothetical protein
MVLLVMHTVLQYFLARNDIVSSIFAAGSHVPRWMFVCTVLFVANRLALLLLVPVLLARRAAILLVQWGMKSTWP